MGHQFGSTRVRALLIVLLCLALLGGSLVSGNYCPCGTVESREARERRKANTRIRRANADTLAAALDLESILIFALNASKQTLLRAQTGHRLARKRRMKATISADVAARNCVLDPTQSPRTSNVTVAAVIAGSAVAARARDSAERAYMNTSSAWEGANAAIGRAEQAFKSLDYPKPASYSTRYPSPATDAETSQRYFAVVEEEAVGIYMAILRALRESQGTVRFAGLAAHLDASHLVPPEADVPTAPRPRGSPRYAAELAQLRLSTKPPNPETDRPK